MNQTTNSAPSYTEDSPVPVSRRSLYRPVHDRMLAGVAAGIGRYLGVDTLVVRIALVVLAFIGGIGVPLYLACWLLIPEEGRESSIADEFAGTVHDWRD
jgi:phage shock protein PspC (stress-responsive transcriptional regulator)